MNKITKNNIETDGKVKMIIEEETKFCTGFTFSTQNQTEA